MLDDPVEESLDAAVDTRRSNVAVAHETVADSLIKTCLQSPRNPCSGEKTADSK